jgi:hypothetical protein
MRGVEMHAHVPKIGKTPIHWLLEGLLIVISVALGFGVAQFRESRANRELGARVLRGLQTEIEQNLALLERQSAMHQRWLEALSQPNVFTSHKTAREVFLATWPDLNRDKITDPFPLPRRGAWDAALSTGALRLIDYDVVAALSEIYQRQQSLESAVEKMPYSSTSFFDPVQRDAAAIQLAFEINAIELSENFLVDAYRRDLPIIRAAANAER